MSDQSKPVFSVKLKESAVPSEHVEQIEHAMIKKVVQKVLDEPNQDPCVHSNFPDT